MEFWLGGEGHQIPEEYIGPRIMVQLRDRAAQLVKHLNNSDVNKAGGMQKIFDVLEKSPLVKQLDKHRVDQHRKRLMSLSRFAGESLESYITRAGLYRDQLAGRRFPQHGGEVLCGAPLGSCETDEKRQSLGENTRHR